jgi:hypothetical protein
MSFYTKTHVLQLRSSSASQPTDGAITKVSYLNTRQWKLCSLWEHQRAPLQLLTRATEPRNFEEVEPVGQLEI